MLDDWVSLWYIPTSDDIVVYITLERIAEIGGGAFQGSHYSFHVSQGNTKLSQWCRVNCKLPGRPVSIRGKTAWVFKNSDDAVLFKLTWV